MDHLVEEDLFAEEFAEMERLKLQKKNNLSQITQSTAPVRSSVYSVPSVSNQDGDGVSSNDEKNYFRANVIVDNKKGNKEMDNSDSAYESAIEDPYMRRNKHEIPKEEVKQSSGTECESGGHELDNLLVLKNEPHNLANPSASLPSNLGKTKETTICAGKKKLHLVWEEMQNKCETNNDSQPKYDLRENPKKKVWPSYYVVG